MKTALFLGAALLWITSPACLAAQPPGGACQAYLEQGLQEHRRVFDAAALIEMVDIGDPTPFFQSAELELSPDGRHLAFAIRRADIANNRNCTGVAIVDLDQNRPVLVVGVSDELVMGDLDYWGVLLRDEVPKRISVRWSHNGTALAFERRTGSATHLWVYQADGRSGVPLACTAGGIDRFAWSPAGNRMIVTPRQGRSDPRSDEADQGYHYDERFMPMVSTIPLEIARPARGDLVVDLDRMSCGPLTADRDEAPWRRDASPSLEGAKGNQAVIESEAPERIGAPTRIRARAAGREYLCPASQCNRAEAVWWVARDTLVLVRRAGPAGSQTAVYLWRLGRSPRRVRTSNDVLAGCARLTRELICAQESATSPRRIIAIDFVSGRERLVYDPNPGFPATALAPAKRLHWVNAMGTPTFGDLILPRTPAGGGPLPLVVTTYTSRGFLRGATGDEYPVQLFAQKGFAVLCLERPRDAGMDTPGIATALDQVKYATQHWRDRLSVHSSLTTIVERLVAEGIADPARIGLTGLSDGATTVTFALLNSTLFKAAAISSCCVEPGSIFAALGPATARRFHNSGYPGMGPATQKAWASMSIPDNAEKVNAPLLMQLGSEELRMAILSHAALRDAGKPVELYVFPGEGHVKMQPRHRLAVYYRSLAWFEFWLQGKRDTDLASPEELARWDTMADRQRPNQAKLDDARP